MAPLPTIGNVVRCDLQWRAVAGVPSHSTFHILTSSTDLEQIALDIGSAFDDGDQCWDFHYTMSASINDILLTPLDGVTAGQQLPLGTTLNGQGAGGVLPAAAAVLSFRTNQRGPRGRGRIYIGPLGENDVEDGLVSSTIRNGTVTAWQDFNTSLAASSTAGSLCVASYTHATASGVTSIGMRLPMGTVRHRQDQLT